MSRTRSDRVDDREWLRGAYASRTIAEIAAELGVSTKTVSRRLRAFEIVTRGGRQRAFHARRPELNDPVWLRDRYSRGSSGEIAAELGVNAQQILAALHRHGIEVRSGPETLRHPILHDPQALFDSVASSSVDDVAAANGVTPVAVRAALRRHDSHSIHRFDGVAPMPGPDATVLAGWWADEGTIKGVARRGDVSVNTASIWLARIGIFLHQTPAIARPDLVAAIAAGESIAAIGRRHRVTGRTVVVELYRHELFDAHRRRHIPPPSKSVGGDHRSDAT